MANTNPGGFLKIIAAGFAGICGTWGLFTFAVGAFTLKAVLGLVSLILICQAIFFFGDFIDTA